MARDSWWLLMGPADVSDVMPILGWVVVVVIVFVVCPLCAAWHVRPEKRTARAAPTQPARAATHVKVTGPAA